MKYRNRRASILQNAQNHGFADMPGLGPKDSTCANCSGLLDYYSYLTGEKKEKGVCLKRLEHRGEGERLILERTKDIRAVQAARAAAPLIEGSTAACCLFRR